jgi:ribosomal protein S8
MTHISQILTCIRNAKNAKLNYIVYSINQEERVINIVTILTILRNNGIIRAFSNLASNNGKNKFVIYIKYDQVGNSVIRSIFNVSKPSRKLYISNKSL